MSVSGQDSISLIKAVKAKGFDNMSTLIESSTENTDVSTGQLSSLERSNSTT